MIRYLSILAFVHCGKPEPLKYHYAPNVSDIDASWSIDAAEMINEKLGCKWIEISSGILGDNIEFHDREELRQNGELGDLNEVTKTIRITSYETAPYIFGNSKSISASDTNGKSGFKRLVIHELGHAMGLSHTDNFDDIMYGCTAEMCNSNLKNEITKEVWARYLEQLRKAGVSCPQ